MFKRHRETGSTGEISPFTKISCQGGISPLSFSKLFGLFLFLLHVSASMAKSGVNPHTAIEDFSFFLSLPYAVRLYLLFSATENSEKFSRVVLSLPGKIL